jgi:hypothetical protein
VVLELLEGLERREIGIAVVESDHEADGDPVVSQVIDEASAVSI